MNFDMWKLSSVKPKKDAGKDSLKSMLEINYDKDTFFCLIHCHIKFIGKFSNTLI